MTLETAIRSPYAIPPVPSTFGGSISNVGRQAGLPTNNVDYLRIIPYSLVTSCIKRHRALIFYSVRESDRGKIPIRQLAEYLNQKMSLYFCLQPRIK